MVITCLEEGLVANREFLPAISLSTDRYTRPPDGSVIRATYYRGVGVHRITLHQAIKPKIVARPERFRSPVCLRPAAR